MTFVKTMKNIFFLFHASWIILSELALYEIFNNYMSFIDRLTSRLASINILYVKIFQAFALNNKLIDEQLNNYLLKYTDNAPWSSNDIDTSTLYKLEEIYPISFDNYGFEPLNSGMISLVFKATNTLTEEEVIIKYPPSIAFIMITLGMLSLLFWLISKFESYSILNPLIVFGKVPLFFYFAHYYLYIVISKFTDHAISLSAMYVLWIVGLIILYPVCKYNGQFKKQQSDNSFWRLL